MKNRFKNLGVLLFALSMTNCSNEFLEVVPTDQLSSATFWNTENDAKMALASCYANFDSYMNVAYLDTGSDNAYQKNNFWYETLANGNQTAVSSPNNLYGNWLDKNSHTYFLYTRIRNFNSFLENIGKVKMDEKIKARYIAEVRFLRAYDYFWKVMFYGDIPLVTKTFANPSDANLPRTPKAEVEAFILKELSECAADLPEYNMIESNGHVTRGAAYALKARLELYLGQYDAAKQSAAKVIEMSCFELFPDYKEMFHETSEGTNKEAIMSIKYNNTTNAQRLTQTLPPCSQGGYASIDVTWDMVEAYQMSNGKYIDDAGSGYDVDRPFDNRDPRFEASVVYPGGYYNGALYNPLDKLIDGVKNVDNYSMNTNGSLSGTNVIKFVHPVDFSMVNYYDADIMVIRLAEVYLIYAEAAWKTGSDMDKGLEYINRIRSRAGMPAATKLDEKTVKYERRVELAFEGLRYFDIKRWDLGPTVFNRAIKGCRKGTMDKEGNITWTGDHVVMEKRKFDPARKYLLPIPQAELDRNPEMTQNEGY